MGAYANISELVKYSTSGSAEVKWVTKETRVAGAAANSSNNIGRMVSLWQYEGCPSHGAVPPTTAANPTNITTGSLMQTNPPSGSQKWLQSMFVATNTIAQVYLYDRLMHISGLSGIVTTPQTVSGSVTRYTGTESVGNMIAVEIYTTIGTTATTITANYVNQDGIDKTTTAEGIGGTELREAQRMIILPLAAGDTGVRRVDSVTLAGTTGTAGDFGVNIIRLLYVGCCNLAGLGVLRSYMDGPMVEIKENACLAFAAQMQGSLTPAPMIANVFMTVR